MTENKTPICKECKTPVESTAAKKYYEQYQGVYCPECRKKIDKAIEDGLIAGDKADEPTPKANNTPALKDDEDGFEIEPYDGKTIPPELTTKIIRDYICPQATDQEAYTFLQLCSARNLNPFTKEAYLIKYGSSPATMIVGKDAFTQRAEAHIDFDGFEAGIIIGTKENKIEERDGAFVAESEVLLGGWAKVHRKNRKVATVARVSMSEYNTKKSSWIKIPATMIRKVALVQALREAFPSDLGGCYDASEMGV